MDSVIYEERFERWLKVSIGLARFDPFYRALCKVWGKWMQLFVRRMFL